MASNVLQAQIILTLMALKFNSLLVIIFFIQCNGEYMFYTHKIEHSVKS